MSSADDPGPGLRCIECRYDLAGLAQSALCPECGTAVANSQERRAAPLCSLDHVRRLIGGTRLAAIGAGAMSLLVIVDAVFTLFNHWEQLLPRLTVRLALLALIVPANALWIAGVHLCTRPEDDVRALPADRRIRRSAVVAMFVQAGALLMLLSGLALHGDSRSGRAVLVSILAVHGCFWLASAGLGFVHLGAMVRQSARARDERFEKIARDLRWPFAVAVPLGSLLVWIGPCIGFTFYCMLLFTQRKKLIVVERMMRDSGEPARATPGADQAHS